MPKSYRAKGWVDEIEMCLCVFAIYHDHHNRTRERTGVSVCVEWCRLLCRVSEDDF